MLELGSFVLAIIISSNTQSICQKGWNVIIIISVQFFSSAEILVYEFTVAAIHVCSQNGGHFVCSYIRFLQ